MGFARSAAQYSLCDLFQQSNIRALRAACLTPSLAWAGKRGLFWQSCIALAIGGVLWGAVFLLGFTRASSFSRQGNTGQEGTEGDGAVRSARSETARVRLNY